MSLGSRVRMGGWICAISLPERWYGCRNAGFGPNFTNSLFVARQIRVKPYPSKQKKGGEGTRPDHDPRFQKAKAQHGVFVSKPLADLNLDYHEIKNMTIE